MNKADVDLHTLEGHVVAKLSTKNISDFETQILGKILTIMDASITDHKQRDALRQLIMQATWDVVNDVFKWMKATSEGKDSIFPY